MHQQAPAKAIHVSLDEYLTVCCLAEQASSFMSVFLPWSMGRPQRILGAPAMATQHSRKQSKRRQWLRMTKLSTAKAHLQSSDSML